MPEFLERKLKAEYGQNSKVPYKVMNAIGAMHGNKETAKGREMEKKHEAKMGHGFASTHIEHHSDGSHTVTHHPKAKASGKSGAFMEHGEATTYTAANDAELMDKMHGHFDPDGDGD